VKKLEKFYSTLGCVPTFTASTENLYVTCTVDFQYSDSEYRNAIIVEQRNITRDANSWRAAFNSCYFFHNFFFIK